MKNFVGILLAISALASCNAPKEPAKKVAQTLPTRVVNPPIPAADVPFETYTFEAEKGAKIAYKTGTQIEIPANALTDEAGKPIKGEVKLAYREFHDALDVLVSGIPMQYDSAGTRQSLQTAGMFDIRASQADKPLKLAQDKKAKIRMASWQPDQDYNFYSLNEQTGAWSYQTREKVEVNTAKVTAKVAIDQMKGALPTTRFILNVGNAFDISVENEYPKTTNESLKTSFKQRFQGYKVQYAGEAYSYQAITVMGIGEHPAHDLIWEMVGNAALPALPALPKDKYPTFYEAIPVALGNGTYRLEYYKGWKGDDGKNQAIAFVIAKPIMRIASLLQHSPEKWLADEKTLMEKIRIEEERIKLVADVFRPIEVSNFGIHNFDRYLKSDMAGKAVFVDASFQLNGKQNKLADKEIEKIFYINPKIRSNAEYAGGSWNMLGMVKEPSVRIFALLKGYRIATVEPTAYNRIDFSRLQPDARKKDRAAYTFTLHEQQDLVKSQAELRKALQMN